MISALATAVSSLNAATAELDASASNLANEQTVGPMRGAGWGPATVTGPAGAAGAAQAYQPVAAVLSAAPGGGVSVQLAPVSPGTRPAYDPMSPFANTAGLVAAPAVDASQEAVAQIGALALFQANLATVRAAEKMQDSLLAIA